MTAAPPCCAAFAEIAAFLAPAKREEVLAARRSRLEADSARNAQTFAIRARRKFAGRCLIIAEVKMKRPAVTKKERELREKHEHAIDSEAILGYQRHRVGAALPWDHERHAVNAPWAKLSGDIGPRESGRGIRNGI